MSGGGDLTHRHDTGLHSAYLVARDAYFYAPTDERDDMLIGALCLELLREIRDPKCTYVVGHQECGKPADWDATGRALCPEHMLVVGRQREGRAARSRS